MGMADAQRAVSTIREHPDEAAFVGPREETVVAGAEEALGFRLPATFRYFVSELGAGGFGSRELYGVIDRPSQNSSVPDAIWLTLNQRRFGFPKDLLIIGDTGAGEYYVLDARRPDPDGEYPVAIWHPGVSQAGDPLEEVAPDFGTFLLQIVEREAAGGQ